MSQEKKTTDSSVDNIEVCPAQKLLKLLSGKLKPEIFNLATRSTLRFNSILREIQGANKQSLSIALRELEEVDLLKKVVVKQSLYT